MNKCRGSGGRRGRRFGSIGRSNDPQLRPNTLFKGCSRELSLLLLPSLLPPRQNFVLAICLPSTTFTGIPSPLSRIITPVISKLRPHHSLHTLRDKLSFTGLDRNKPTDDCLLARTPASKAGGQGEHIFAALYALFPPNDFLAAVSLRKSRLRQRERKSEGERERERGN